MRTLRTLLCLIPAAPCVAAGVALGAIACLCLYLAGCLVALSESKPTPSNP